MEEERRAILHERMRVLSAVQKFPPRTRHLILSEEPAGLLDASKLEELNSFIDRFPLRSHELIDWSRVPGSVSIEWGEGESEFFSVARRVLREFAKVDEQVVVVWGALAMAPFWITRHLLDPLLEELDDEADPLWFIKLESREVLELGPESFSWGRLG